MPKRLLIVTDEMEVGGTQRQIVEMAKCIDRTAFDVSLLYFRSHSPYVDELREGGVEVTCIPKNGRFDFGFFLRLCRFVRNGDFDLIHGFSFAGEAWGWLANFVAGNARFIGSVRSVYEWYSPLQWQIKRWITLNSAALVANSQAGADHAALKMGIRRQMVNVVHNCICLPAANGADSEPGKTERTGERVLFIGRLVDHKNLECLLRAMAAVHEAAPAARLDIVGDGPERVRLEAMTTSLQLDKVVSFHGEQHEVGTFLRKADVYVLTSWREGLSNALMEAMSAGLPVVVSNVGGNCELVSHDVSGMLFPSDDHETLAAMLLELLSDKARRERLGNNARAAMQHFHDPRKMTMELERIYERCLVDDKAYELGR